MRKGQESSSRSQVKVAGPKQASEKDATELRLEKALFGDDAAFLNSLKSSRQEREQELQLSRSKSDTDGIDAREGDEHVSDVRTTSCSC